MKTIGEIISEGGEALVVDDLPSAQKIVTRFLRRIGVQKTHQCSSSEQAYRMILNHPEIQIVVSDIVMPDETGHQLLKRLEKIERCQNLIIILTSVSDKDNVGIETYRGMPLEPIKKPFTREELERKINAFITNAQKTS
jgi:DNA-binding NtrC family response regulator